MQETKTTFSSPKKYEDALNIQMTVKSKPVKYVSNAHWVAASRTEVDSYLNPNNYASGDALYQHCDLSKDPGVTADQLNKYLKGRGTLNNMGQAYIDGGRAANVNPIYLALHSITETGGGTSKLGTGTVSGYQGYYNMYGIGATDDNADKGGAAYAKRQGWNSVYKAIVGGAKFVGSSFIYKGQNTLYKMRWNPQNPGSNQYCTSIEWPSLIGGQLGAAYRSYFSNAKVSLLIPSYDGQGSTTVTDDALGPKIVEEARKYLGYPYVWGGSTPSGFDCSGFTMYLYKKVANIQLEHFAASQYNHGNPVELQNLRGGDLVFFHTESGRPKYISHVGLAVGDGTFIAAQNQRVGVAIGKLSDSYWSSAFSGAKRILSDSDTEGGFGSGGDIDYTSIVNDDTPTGLANGLPLSAINELSEELDDALTRLSKDGANRGSIIDLKNGGEIRFFIPDDISDSTPVSWEDVAILGRSVPIKGYENSGPRTINFELELFAGAGYYAIQSDPIYALNSDVAFLQSLVYPDYSKSFVRPPATVLLALGNIVKLKCVCTSAEVTWKKPHTLDGQSMHAVISLSFAAISDVPPDYRDIKYKDKNSIG